MKFDKSHISVVWEVKVKSDNAMPFKWLNLFQYITPYHGFNSACSYLLILSVMEYFSESPPANLSRCLS